jgi:hypothetical protein
VWLLVSVSVFLHVSVFCKLRLRRSHHWCHWESSTLAAEDEHFCSRTDFCPKLNTASMLGCTDMCGYCMTREQQW